MPRIKIVGYYDVENLDDAHTDTEDQTGLSSDGYDELIAGNEGRALSVSDLEDVDVTLVEE